MINRVFFISDVLSENIFPSGSSRLPEENVFYSVLADPAAEGSLENAYAFAERNTECSLALTLQIREPLSQDQIRSITSFLFIPSYLTVGYRPVINLAGESPALLADSATALSSYLTSQGIVNPLVHILTGEPETVSPSGHPAGYPSFRSGDRLSGYYRQLLQSDRYFDNDIFFYAASSDTLRAALTTLRQAEIDFERDSPKLHALLAINRRLERELGVLTRKQTYTETELNNQRQYLDVLRSGHAAKEIQDYYTREYEILPLWYKRFGHIIKVLTGKRTFKSLFRDRVKKYKD